MKTIEQTVLKVGFREYQTEVTHADNSIDIREFSDTNAVFPAYKSLMHALARYEGEQLHIKTDSYALATEYNATLQNPNASLLTRLKDKIAERKLNVTIEYVG